MTYNKVFFHGAGPGIGDMIRRIDAALIPFVVKSIKNEGWVLEALQYTNADHQIIYRDPQPNGRNDDHPDLNKTPLVAAQDHWENFRRAIPQSIKDARDRVWIEPMNEIDTHANGEWLGELQFHYANLTLQDGYRVLLSGHNAGQPEPEHWETYFRPFLELCDIHPGSVGVTIHEGKIDGDFSIPASSERWVPHLIGRYKYLHEACDRMGLKRPTIFISEWAWGPFSLPNDQELVRSDIAYLSEEVAKHSNIRGVCLWNLDRGWKDATKMLPQYIPYIENLTLNIRYPDPLPPPDPEPEPEVTIRDITDKLPRHETKTYRTRQMLAIKRIAIHHTVTSSSSSAVAHIAKYHVDALGWPGIGYHFVIDGDGAVYQTNELSTVSYHVGEFNAITLGIAMLGDFTNEWPTPGQIRSCNWLLKELRNNILPLNDLELNQHRDISATSCPGRTAPEWFSQLVLPPKPPQETLEEFIWEDSLDTQAIRINPQAALQRRIFDEDLIPVSSEQEVVHGDKTYVYMTGEADPDVRIVRKVFVAEKGDWENIIEVIEPAGEPPDTTPLPPLPDVEFIDMAQYFWPESGPFGDIIILKNNWGGGDERQQLQVEEGGSHTYVTKNQQWERRVITEDFIYLVMDTSPGNNQYYTYSGAWIPTRWQVGQLHITEGRTTFYNKGDCSEVTTYFSATMLKLRALHETYTTEGGVTFENVAEVWWVGKGGEREEEYWYAPGVGLVEWKNRHGKHSWATERIPAANQSPNEREVIPCEP